MSDKNIVEHENIKFLCVHRNGYDVKDENLDIQVDFLKPVMDISSTEIRNDIEENIEQIPEKIGQSVIDYLKKVS